MNNLIITGRGCVHPFGTDFRQFFTGVVSQNNPADSTHIPDPEATSDQTLPRRLNLRKSIKSSLYRRLDDHALCALIAARAAVRESGLRISDCADDVGIILGSGTAGFSVSFQYIQQVLTQGPEQASPMLFTNTVLNAPAAHIAIDLGLHGINLTCSRRFSSGLQSIVLACEAVRHGKARVVIAGGVDLQHPGLQKIRDRCVHRLPRATPPGTCSYRLLPDDTQPDKPVRQRRNSTGYNLSDQYRTQEHLPGEGAYCAVIEDEAFSTQRGADTQACIGGWVWHILDDIHAAGIAGTVEKALTHADCRARDIRYIITSCTFSPVLERIETDVLRDMFPRRPLWRIPAVIGNSDASGAASVLIASELTRRENGPVLVNHFDPDGNAVTVIVHE